MIDSHCHLDDERFEGDRDLVITRARAAGVRGFVLAGVGPEGWPQQEKLTQCHGDMVYSAGVHPQWVSGQGEVEVTAALAELLAWFGRVDGVAPVAVGETGLDRSPVSPPATLPRQTRAFREQLALARELNLPVMLHILRMHEEALLILKRDGLPRAGGVVHSYSGSAELVPRYTTLGLHLAIPGTVSYLRAPKIWAAAAAIPDDRLLIETDAPDQTPEPHRPGRNEPAYLSAIVSALARVRGCTPEDLVRQTTLNTRRLFRLGSAA